MTGSQKDIPNSQPVPTNAQKEASVYKDEINLIDYFAVLWKRKYIIILCSVLPALVVGLITFSRPRDYKMTYLYDVGLDEKGYGRGIDLDGEGYGRGIGLDGEGYGRGIGLDGEGYGRGIGLGEKDYKMLLDGFYSAENLDKITSKLRENGLDEYARKVAGATTDGALKKLVGFEVSPSYFGITGTKGVIDIKNPQVGIEKIYGIQQLRGTLLSMTVVGTPKEDMYTIASIIRDNFGKILPMYSLKQELLTTIVEHKAQMAGIEGNRFALELDLKTKRAILERLRNIRTTTLDETGGNIALQFDIGDRGEFMPLGYQIRAAESNIIKLEEGIKGAEERYAYYESLLALNEKLLGELKDKTSSYYAIEQFHSFLTGLVNSCQTEPLKDYLTSYIKRVENRISASVPVTERPKVYGAARGTVKKTVIVFMALLIITIFLAFLYEGIQKGRTQVL